MSLNYQFKTPVGIEVLNITIISEEKVKLLGIHIDNRLNLIVILVNSAKRLGKKLHAQTRVFK